MLASISGDELYQKLLQKSDLTLLDIRNSEQHKNWSIYGSINIPFNKLFKKFSSLSKNKQLIVYCNRGNDSRLATDFLDKKGFNALTLKGGLKKWNSIYDPVKLFKVLFPAVTVYQFKRLGKGCLSYLAVDHKNQQTHIIDPSREWTIYGDFVKINKLPKISSVVDTHVHSDHVSGGVIISKKFKIPYLLPRKSPVKFRFNPLLETINKFFKGIKVKVIFTPGHTPESVTLVIDKHYAFTGDTLFLDTVGRIDLYQGNEKSGDKDIYNSITQKIFKLDDDLYILPAHSSQPLTAGPLRSATLRYVKRFNILNTDTSLKEFTDKIKETDNPFPPNFRLIKEINMSGKIEPDLDLAEIELGGNSCAIRN